MITALLFWADAKATNPKFNPDILYLGTIIIDLCIVDVLYKMAG